MAQEVLARNSLSIRLEAMGPGAEVRFSKGQILFFVICIALLLLIGWSVQFSLLTLLQGFVALAAFFFFAVFLFSLRVVVAGMSEGGLINIGKAEMQRVLKTALPNITVIVALYKEDKKIVLQLVKALMAMKYPANLFQVVIVIEEEDLVTKGAFHVVTLPSTWRVVVRPKGGVMTKPGALNYVLDHGYIGDDSHLTVVFDAEDIPDPYQFLKAVVAFRKARRVNPNVVCVQARLSFGQNYSTNWLTQMLHLDYLLHFGLMLPGVSRLGLICPLGGTSNYLLTEVLRTLKYDSRNVTEDLDLAVRMRRLGYGTAVFESVTSEEAVTTPHKFVKQRSRWIKGAMQTYFRHMRNPIQLFRDLGWNCFWGFQFGIGAPLVLCIINPGFWLMTLVYAITHMAQIRELYQPLVFYVASFCFVAGNFSYIYFILIGAFRAKQYDSVPFALLGPVYWVLLSIAGYKAAWEFLQAGKTSSWEKTTHLGLG